MGNAEVFFLLASQELRIGQWMHFCGTTKLIQVPAGHQKPTTIPQVLLLRTGSGLDVTELDKIAKQLFTKCLAISEALRTGLIDLQGNTRK